MPRRDAPPLTRGVVLRAFGMVLALALAALAVWLIVTDSSRRMLELGVVAGLWSALIGAFAMFGARRAHEPAPAAAPPVQREVEIGQRRDFEERLQQLLRREIDSAVTREVAVLRTEITQLRHDLLEKVGGQLRLERIEVTRVIGSDLEALQDEVRQLKSSNAAITSARVQVVEPARTRPVLRAAVADSDEPADAPDPRPAVVAAGPPVAPPGVPVPPVAPQGAPPPYRRQAAPARTAAAAATPAPAAVPVGAPAASGAPAAAAPAAGASTVASAGPAAPPYRRGTPPARPADPAPATEPSAEEASATPATGPAAPEPPARDTAPVNGPGPIDAPAADTPPAVAGPAHGDPFASLPRLTPFTDFELGADDRPAAAAREHDESDESDESDEPSYSGRRRRTDLDPDDRGGRRRRADEDSGSDNLLARLLARETGR